MSGRFQNTGRGRGGRGRGNRSSNAGRNSAPKKKEKKLIQFVPIVRNTQPEVPYLVVKRDLIEEMGLMKMDNVDTIIDAVRDEVDCIYI
jgi:hypothetical protein